MSRQKHSTHYIQFKIQHAHMEGNTFHTSSNTINSAVRITENMSDCFFDKHKSKSLCDRQFTGRKYTAVSKNQLHSLCYIGDIQG